MSAKKLDWYDFVANASQEYGLQDSDWDPLRRSAVIRFDYDEKGFVSGVYQGKPVYRDSNHELDINPGDIWIVSLTMNYKTNNNYFAKPLQKVDGAFLYQMKKEQIDELSMHLWESNRMVLEPFLEERYKDVMSEQISKAVKAQTEELEKTVSDLQAQLAEQKKINEEDKSIIESNEEKIRLLSAKVLVMENEPGSTPAPRVEAKEERHIQQFELSSVRKAVVERSGPDMLRSEVFDKSRYYVNLSADHRIVLVRENKNGNVVCVDNTIMLDGLNTILPFEEECLMNCEYNNRYGGYVVYLS